MKKYKLEELNYIYLDWFVAESLGLTKEKVRLGTYDYARITPKNDVGGICSIEDASELYDHMMCKSFAPHKNKDLVLDIIKNNNMSIVAPNDICNAWTAKIGLNEYSSNDFVDCVLKVFILSKLGTELKIGSDKKQPSI